MYDVLLYVHIVCAAIWVGGAFYAQGLAIRVSRSDDPMELPRLGRNLEFIGSWVFMPAAVLLFLAGVGMTAQAWSFGQAWIAVSIALWVLSALAGAVYLAPRAKQAAALFGAEGARVGHGSTPCRAHVPRVAARAGQLRDHHRADDLQARELIRLPRAAPGPWHHGLVRLDRIIRVVDAHAGGEPGRVIVGGVHDVPGASMLRKRDHLWRHDDRLRRLVLREPRGYPATCANLVVPPTLPEADAGFIIMEQAEYPAMSGSNTICTATVLIEERLVTVTEPITELVLEAPAGLIRVQAEVRDGRARSITFENVPAFVMHLDRAVEVPQIGTISVDVAWGGMFYALADAISLGFRLTPDEGRDLVRVGEMIKAAAREQIPVAHPENPELAGISIVQLTGPPSAAGAHAKNTVVVSSGELDWSRPESFTGVLDRSPCGTGTCARMAVQHARGELAIGQDFVHEGILGTTWTGRLLRETTVGRLRAVLPQLTGSAWITGRADLVVDDDDPFPNGFTVGDLWGLDPETKRDS